MCTRPTGLRSRAPKSKSIGHCKNVIYGGTRICISLPVFTFRHHERRLFHEIRCPGFTGFAKWPMSGNVCQAVPPCSDRGFFTDLLGVQTRGSEARFEAGFRSGVQKRGSKRGSEAGFRSEADRAPSPILCERPREADRAPRRSRGSGRRRSGSPRPTTPAPGRGSAPPTGISP